MCSCIYLYTAVCLSVCVCIFCPYLRGCSGASCCTGLNCRTDKGEQWKWKQWRGTVRGFGCKDPTMDVNAGAEMDRTIMEHIDRAGMCAEV